MPTSKGWEVEITPLGEANSQVIAEEVFIMSQKSDLAVRFTSFQLPQQDDEVVAWQEVEEGRFMPQRVRGSCQGRAPG